MTWPASSNSSVSSSGENGVLGQHHRTLREVENTVRKGDLVRFKRDEGYYHYALYIGQVEGIHMIIHVTTFQEDGRLKAMKKCDTLSQVAGKDKVQIANHDEYARANFGLPPRSTEEIIDSAKAGLGQECHYDLIGNNCEHYSTMWRYGQGFSTQAQRAANITSAVAVTSVTSMLLA